MRKCAEGDCGRRRDQKCTPFTRTIVGLIEPEHLVQVRRTGGVASMNGGRVRRTLPWGSVEGGAGSDVFPVEKKRDLRE